MTAMSELTVHEMLDIATNTLARVEVIFREWDHVSNLRALDQDGYSILDDLDNALLWQLPNGRFCYPSELRSVSDD